MERSRPLGAGPDTSVWNREMIFMILQFLGEEKFKESVHKLEQESGLFFDIKYFEEQVEAGEWKEVERYLSGFIKVNDNDESRTIFFEIRKQKYLEALDSQDRPKAIEILMGELRVASEENHFSEMTHLLTLGNFRQNEKLSNYGDVKSQRKDLIDILRRRIELNPSLRHKLKLPAFEASSLRKMVKRFLLMVKSHKSQHELYKNSNPSPDMNTHCTNYTCLSNKGNDVPASNTTLTKLIPRRKVSHPLEGHHAPCSSAIHSANVYSADDLPKTVVRKLGEATNIVTSMDFHPQIQNVLLVGLWSGDITIWEVDSGKRIRKKLFMLWDLSARSKPFQTIMKDRYKIPVKRCAWSPDGFKFGVAFSIHIVQIYSYSSTGTVRQLFEIDAHVGGVNDIVFVNPKEKSCILTCGDDKTIKIWDAVSGAMYHTFEGHEAPVYSICPQYNRPACTFYSISTDGKMKAWLYDTFELIANYDTPELKYRRLAFSADETRIFCCITSEEQGACQLVEWCGRERVIKRTYLDCTNVPLRITSEQGARILQFETIGNRFLAVGDKRQIKFWDMDNENMLACTDPDPLLPTIPQIRVNKAGSVLSSTRCGGGMIILANADVQSEFKMRKKRSFNGDRDLSKQGNAQATVESRGG